MTKITVDSELRSKLHNLDSLIELCDETGRTLGYFHPALTGPLESPHSIEELERRRQNPTGRSLREILKDLGAI